MMSEMLSILNLCVGYERRIVLHDISLTVGHGEFTGILGPNGSGKTTLVRTLSGILQPSSGSVRIAGRDACDLSARARAKLCATVAQNASTVNGIRVLSLVLMGRYPYLSFFGGYTADDHAQVDDAMLATGCHDLGSRLAGSLSGGELQRVVMAKALAQDTDLLLLDEAASNLDIARTMDLYELLRARNRSGLTILTVAHDLNLAALYCQRLIFLKNGRIVADGPTRDVFTEQTLSEIYETSIAVAAHPVTGNPQAYLLPRP